MKTFYRRKLPHWLPPEATFFITFRLANSLPQSVLQELLAERDRERKQIEAQFSGVRRKEAICRLEKKYFGHFDAWLDRCLEPSPRWLAEPRVARIVSNYLHKLDGERYHLLAYCIMPNHVHLLIDTRGFDFRPEHSGATTSYPITDTLKQIKGTTARYCNQALGRRGTFWQSESYDHVVRDTSELKRTIWYVLENPVKAGLVARWQDWKWTYCIPEYRTE